MIIQAVLKVITGPRAGETIKLEAGQEAVVGRSRSCTLSLREDGYISRRHFVLRAGETKLFLEDSNSSHGTFLNDARVRSQVVLNDGDRIRAGQTEFDIQLDTPEVDSKDQTIELSDGSRPDNPSQDQAGS